MTTPYWIPFLGWVPLTDQHAEVLELDSAWDWRALNFEWLGFGFTFFVKAYVRAE